MKIIVWSFLCLVSIQPLIAKDNAIAKLNVSMTLKDTLPVPPAFIRCGDGKQGYGLYWTDKSTDETKFKIYRAVNGAKSYTPFSEIKSKTAATTGTEYFCKIDYLPENFYNYTVTSVNKAGESNTSTFAFIKKF